MDLYRLIKCVFIWSGAGMMMHGQQALLLFGNAVVVKDNLILEVPVAVDENKKFIKHEGNTYPYGRKSYSEIIDDNNKKFGVLNRIHVHDGRLLFDANLIKLKCPVDNIYQALQWGNVIACLGVIPAASKAWSSSMSYAIFVFSPESGIGTYKELGRTGKAKPRLILLDPIDR